MNLEIDDLDVVFAYPWSGEERVIERLFDLFASDGALLMTCNGAEGVRLFRRRTVRRSESVAGGSADFRFPSLRARLAPWIERCRGRSIAVE